MSDANPAAAPSAAATAADADDVTSPSRPELSLREAWAGSAALAYFVIAAIAALAIGLGRPAVEWAFEAARLFR